MFQPRSLLAAWLTIFALLGGLIASTGCEQSGSAVAAIQPAEAEQPAAEASTATEAEATAETAVAEAAAPDPAAPAAAAPGDAQPDGMVPILVIATQSLEKFVDDINFMGEMGGDDEFLDLVERVLGEIASQRAKLLGPLAGPLGGAVPADEAPEPEDAPDGAPADDAKPAEEGAPDDAPAAEEKETDDQPEGGAAAQAGNAKAQAARKVVARLPLSNMKGVDPKRPWGAVVRTDGVVISPVAFVPIVDQGLPDMLESFKVIFGEYQELDDGTFQIGAGTMTGVVKESNGWAYIAQTADHLENLFDPLPLVGDLPNRYDISAQWHFQNVPEVLRTLLIDQSGLIVSALVEPRPGESPSQLALRQEMANGGVQFLRRALEEAELVTWGASLDQESSRLVSETLVRPIEGSSLADQIVNMRAVQTRFSGITTMPDSVLTMAATGPLDEGMVEHLSAEVAAYGGALDELIDASPDAAADEVRAAYKELVAELVAAGKATAARGEMDIALAIARTPVDRKPSFTLVAGAAVADSAPLEKVFERLVELAEGDPEVLEAKLNVDEHDGVNIHLLSVKPTDELKPFEKLFGGLKVHVAFGDGVAWVAIGPDALPRLKAAMSAQPADALPLAVSARLQHLVRMFGETLDDQMKLAISVLALNLSSGGPDSDLVTLNVEPTDSGELRIESAMGPGILRTIVVLTPTIPTILQGGAPGAGGLPF